jgi:hypothetical protein
MLMELVGRREGEGGRKAGEVREMWRRQPDAKRRLKHHVIVTCTCT